jgi:fumarate hydratase subunit alpha
MRTIEFIQIVDTVAELCIEASCILPDDVNKALKDSCDNESSPLATSILKDCILNAEISKNEMMPICQDTGFAVFFVELGQDLKINGGDIYQAIQDGTAKGYKKGFLRMSIVKDPIFDRMNTKNNTPAIIYLKLVEGEQIKITLAPKGGGSENMSSIAMLKPSDGRAGVVDFVVNSVINAGGNPCPPVIVGVGIGGTFENAAFLAKKSLLRTIGNRNNNHHYATLELEILEKINASGVGPQGLGGDITALDVHIEYFPCHIASLPVAVNLNCHAARHKTIIL